MVAPLSQMSANLFLERQLAELTKRTKKKHRLVRAGQELSCLDAVYVCRLIELLPERSRVPNLVDESIIVVQECEVTDDANTTFYAQFAYNTDEAVLDDMKEAGIGTLNKGPLPNWPANVVEMIFSLERRWFRPASPRVWSQRFLHVARLMGRLHNATYRKATFRTDYMQPGIDLEIAEDTPDRQTAISTLNLYPRWNVQTY